MITKDRRTAFEFGVTKGALAQDKPVLGICGGQQLLHVVLGGKLIQHIPDTIADPLAHEQPNPRNEPGHVVKVAKGTQLHGIVGAEELQVNSAHHQAAADSPDGIVVNATAPDGVIEGIEAPAYRFCIGVQWHPEFLISEGDAKLFRAFLGAAAAERGERDRQGRRAHRQASGARRPVLAPRCRALDRGWPGQGRRQGAGDPGLRRHRQRASSRSTASCCRRPNGRACGATTSRRARW